MGPIGFGGGGRGDPSGPGGGGPPGPIGSERQTALKHRYSACIGNTLCTDGAS